MTQILTIVKVGDEYSVSGNMPLDEAAKALVVIAYQATPPQATAPEGEKED